ncbi:glycosyltransferase [Plantibacter sp. CFBP 8775]|uniref:glycosyltransferase n=1 Tax=Plantibacter sp. CFBP 8775 TaxID=2774038 RepID=UPI001785C6ED|nr:glycosyltransferase [Plantibacter sp. CFBP 8775]MBD8104057.1 glycosyltransferase [Plantibacter sp. CFBP 8775]
MIGFKRVDSALSRDSDRVAFSGRVVAAASLRLFRLTRLSWRVARLVRSTGVDVVHAHFADDAALIVPTLRLLRVPLVVSVYGFDVSRRELDTRAGRRNARRKADALQYASQVVANSAYMARCAIEAGAPPEKVKVVHLGLVDTHHVKREGAGDGILFVGRLVEKKGLDDLLVAMSLLPSSLREVPLTVVGDGPLGDEMKVRARELNLPVMFLGSRGPDEVAALLRSSRLLCVPSKTASDGDSEGLPTIILDAALESLPSVATSHSGIPEAIRDGVTGRLVPERDPQALSGAITQLLQNPTEALRLGRAARQFVRSEFNIARWADSISGIYALAATDSPKHSTDRGAHER